MTGPFGLRLCVEQHLIEQAQPVMDALRGANLSVVTAESCTGGLIAAVLSHARNASECLHGGFVVYTKAHKSLALGIDGGELKTRGAVNAEIARQMAQGALERSRADIALSVTGVIGSDPDEDGNPPGLVYFAVCRRDRDPLLVKRQFTDENPDEVRRETVIQALELIRRSVDGSLR